MPEHMNMTASTKVFLLLHPPPYKHFEKTTRKEILTLHHGEQRAYHCSWQISRTRLCGVVCSSQFIVWEPAPVRLCHRGARMRASEVELVLYPLIKLSLLLRDLILDVCSSSDISGIRAKKGSKSCCRISCQWEWISSGAHQWGGRVGGVVVGGGLHNHMTKCQLGRKNNMPEKTTLSSICGPTASCHHIEGL